VGVVAMPNMQAGVKRTAELLRSGYPALAQAFASGQVDFQDPELQGDLNRWLSGKRTPGMTPYVQKIAGSYGQDLPLSAPVSQSRRGAPAAVAAPVRPQRPVFDPMSYASQILGQYATGGSVDFTQLPGVVQSSFKAPPPPPPAAPGVPPSQGGRSQAPGAAPPSPVVPGKGIVTSHGWKETAHAGGHTGGLPAFTQPADIMGSPGTKIFAPAGGVITKIGSAQEGGQSYFITGDDGYEYWLGHIDARLPVGARIKANQLIATVSGEHPRPHLHIDRRKM
jgi:murein DD-endopeptidase MepM/ murein hydrolase activator NlpD